MSRKYRINESIFSKWNSKVAYVLGFIYADGHLQDVPNIRAQYLRITSVDKDRLVFIRKVLGSTHPIYKRRKAHMHYKDAFVLSIGSKALFKDLLRIGLHPAKSMDMTMPVISEEYFPHFLRGYFDGDGCLFIERRKSKDGKRTNIRRLSIIFTSGSKVFLEQLGNKLLQSKCIDEIKIYKNGRSFQMRFSTREALLICNLMYRHAFSGSYMKRKRGIFEEYVQIRKLPT